MQTTKDTTTTKPGVDGTRRRFERAGRINTTYMGIAEGKTAFVKLTGNITKFEKRDGTILNFVPVVNLETGEECRLWVSGQLKFLIAEMKDYIGETLEIENTGLVEATVKDEHGKMIETEVYNYSIFRIKE